MSHWFIYLIRTSAGTLYTGMTTDVPRRFAEHDAGGARAARSLRGKGPLTLVYSAHVGDRTAAARLEYAIKQWPRKHKEALVAGEIPLPSVLFSDPG